jgi:hypothetical protein
MRESRIQSCYGQLFHEWISIITQKGRLQLLDGHSLLEHIPY